MRPTPETDAQSMTVPIAGKVVLAKFAKKLERERDEALEAMQNAKLLVREVIQWHRHPESPDYNDCDKEPCCWCFKAQLIVAGNKETTK